MRPQMMLGAILAITQSFGFGAVITALVGFPVPNYCVHTIMHHLDDYGGQRFEMGYASAIATILFFMMIGSNLLVTKILRKVAREMAKLRSKVKQPKVAVSSAPSPVRSAVISVFISSLPSSV